MNASQRRGLIAVFSELVDHVADGERFEVYRFTDNWYTIRASTGGGTTKWTVEYGLMLAELEFFDELDQRRAAGVVGSLLDRLRRPELGGREA